jgi:TonB family protein
MPTTQIPPADPTSSESPSPVGGGKAYEPRYWESAYRDITEAPTVILQLQDDLSRSRRREAFWLSVVVHMVVILLIVNSNRLAQLMPRHTTVVAVPLSSQDKDLTYLALPPDEQKVTRRPNTNILSDKDRIATSKAPQLNRDELRKILDSSRPGRPGPTAPPSPAQQPSAAAPPATTQGQRGQQMAQQQATPPPPPANQMAKLQTPPIENAPKPSFNNGDLSAGSMIAQAARAAAANRGAYAGDGGDYGAIMGRQPTAAMGPMEILSDTQGVDFGPYLARILHDVKMNWYNLVPESARPPIMKKGKVAIEFAIMKDGTVRGMQLEQGGSSGDPALDRAAWGGITASVPFPPLPDEFHGQYLALRFHFYYNPDRGDLR